MTPSPPPNAIRTPIPPSARLWRMLTLWQAGICGSRIADSLRERRVRLRGWRLRQGAAVWIELALVAAVFLYGALLRFEALYWKYRSVLDDVGPVDVQAGLARLVSRVRPESFGWIVDQAINVGHYPFSRDQRGYLTFAREMSHVYDVELREPLFVVATKVPSRSAPSVRSIRANQLISGISQDRGRFGGTP